MSTPFVQDSLQRIVSPRIMRCVNTGSFAAVRKRIEVSAIHLVNAPLPAEKLTQIVNPELRELYGFSDGIVLFDDSAYATGSENGQFRIYPYEDLAEVKDEFLQSVERGLARSVGDIEPVSDAERQANQIWLESLIPFAMFRSSGDLLAICSHDGSCVYLDFDLYCYGGVSQDECDTTWPTLSAFLQSIEADYLGFLEGWSACLGAIEETYYVEEITGLR
jgi:hypothetical protein